MNKLILSIFCLVVAKNICAYNLYESVVAAEYKLEVARIVGLDLKRQIIKNDAEIKTIKQIVPFLNNWRQEAASHIKSRLTQCEDNRAELIIHYKSNLDGWKFIAQCNAR